MFAECQKLKGARCNVWIIQKEKNPKKDLDIRQRMVYDIAKDINYYGSSYKKLMEHSVCKGMDESEVKMIWNLVKKYER